ncbi:MAG TPA: electron transfer flavoprotein subunit beta/FixA family protein [Candidatus Binataceae bacterium]|nr:electron transfer flavoprotein subunit beta/FixA family protein [Candidatus Binataceae bacterium]
MKIVVPVKRVPDPATTIRVLPDGSGIATDNVKFVINPFDEIAIEEGLRLKEKHGGEVVLISVGQTNWQEQLRTGLAMGADRAILIKNEQALDTFAIARVIAKVVEDEKPDLVMIGKQAIDDDSNQIGQMIAELLGWPQATFASKVEIANGKCTVVREADGGLQTIAFQLPAVITTDLRLNEPRYASLPGIMKARKKPLKELAVDSLGVDLTPKLKIRTMSAPPKREAGRKVASVEELVAVLHTEAKVI